MSLYLILAPSRTVHIVWVQMNFLAICSACYQSSGGWGRERELKLNQMSGLSSTFHIQTSNLYCHIEVILSNFRNVERNAFYSKQCIFYSYKTLDVRPFRTSLAVYFYRRFLYLFLFMHFSDTDSIQDHRGENYSLQREEGLRPTHDKISLDSPFFKRNSDRLTWTVFFEGKMSCS